MIYIIYTYINSNDGALIYRYKFIFLEVLDLLQYRNIASCKGTIAYPF